MTYHTQCILPFVIALAIGMGVYAFGAWKGWWSL